MSRKIFLGILIIEAVFCLGFSILQIHCSDVFSTMVAFPFEQIGWGLRRLSLSGPRGNMIAIILYVLICFIPFFCFLILKRKDREKAVDLFLPILSILMFFVVYYMINPGLFHTNIPDGEKLILGSTFYAVLFGYLILRVLTMFASADMRQLQKGLHLLFYIMIMLLVYAVCKECFGSLPASIQSVREANEGLAIEVGAFYTQPNIRITILFLVVQCIVNVIPYCMDIMIGLFGMKGLEEVMIDPYSDQAVAISIKIGK